MFRLKPSTDRNSEWRCCFCLHVRTATIILGLWHLILHLVTLAFIAAIIREPRLLSDWESEVHATEMWHDVREPEVQGTTTMKDHSLVYICTLGITLMLVYGASRGKPGHLLPFFCLQLFDFAITTLTATGYVCYLRSVERFVEEAHRVPWKKELLSLPPPLLGVIVLAAFLCAMLVKGYCISIVWRCYKYLTMRSHAVVMPPTVVAPAPQVIPTDYASLLPDYDEAIKQSPPPSYRAATTTTPTSVPSPTNTTAQTPPPTYSSTLVPPLPPGTSVITVATVSQNNPTGHQV